MKKVKSFIKKSIKGLLLTIPFFKVRILRYQYLEEVIKNCGFEPGHFYSPIPNLAEIEKNADTIYEDKKLLEIDLNTDKQINLLKEFKTFYSDYPYFDSLEKHELRYKKEGAFYRFSDAVFLYSVMRSIKPKKIIEVGSGHSSAIMLDINELFFANTIQCTFIEPYPDERLNKIIKESDKIHKFINKKVQSVTLNVFQTLNENDILFIDSTHVSKIGSDVNYLIFEVLPSLKPGVIIHIHDIFYPFELPRHWTLEFHWFWNENYLLRSFLMNNKNYEIAAFNTYLHKIKRDWFKNEMPECLIESENTGSIWIRKLS